MRKVHAGEAVRAISNEGCTWAITVGKVYEVVSVSDSFCDYLGSQFVTVVGDEGRPATQLSARWEVAEDFRPGDRVVYKASGFNQRNAGIVGIVEEYVDPGNVKVRWPSDYIGGHRTVGGFIHGVYPASIAHAPLAPSGKTPVGETTPETASVEPPMPDTVLGFPDLQKVEEAFETPRYRAARLAHEEAAKAEVQKPYHVAILDDDGDIHSTCNSFNTQREADGFANELASREADVTYVVLQAVSKHTGSITVTTEAV